MSPPAGTEVATKHDVAGLGQDLRQEMAFANTSLFVAFAGLVWSLKVF